MTVSAEKLANVLHCVLESVSAHLSETGYVADPNNPSQMDLDLKSAEEKLAEYDEENPSR